MYGQKRKRSTSGGRYGKRSRKLSFFKRRTNRRLSYAVKRVLTKSLEKHRSHYTFNQYVSTTPQLDYMVLAAGQGEYRESYSGNIRDGYKMKPISMTIRGQVAYGDERNLVRLVIFLWYEKTAPDATYILDNGASAGYVFAPFARQNYRYKVLWDKTFNVFQTTKPSIFFRKRFKKLPAITYTADNANAGLPMPYFLVVSDSSMSSHPACTIMATTTLANI